MGVKNERGKYRDTDQRKNIGDSIFHDGKGIRRF